MSIRQLSSEVAKRGRNGDTMLIHVNPREVAGLQYLGERYGAKMTINPDTGLPEAFNFMRFMPMIAGAALSPFITPMGAAAVVGAVEGARTNSLMGGLKGALGAYGGAGIGTSLASFGAEGLGQTALGSAIPEATAALNVPGAVPGMEGVVAPSVQSSATAGLPGGVGESYAVPQATTFSNVGPDQAGELLRSGQITPGAYANYGQTLSQGVSQYNPTTFSNMGEGISRVFKDPTAAGKALIADPMTTAARVGSALIGSQEESKPYEPPEKKTYASSTKAEPYKRNYRENPNPYDTSSEFEYFRPNALYVKEGGYIGMNVGGKPPQVGMPTGLPDDYIAYMQQLQQMINLKGSPAELSQFSAPISQPGFGTQMTKASRPNTYAGGGQINLQGSFNLNPGNMSSSNMSPSLAVMPRLDGSMTGPPGMGPDLQNDMMRPQPAVLPGGPGGYGTQMALGGITRIQKEGQVRGNGDGMEDKVYGNIEGRQKVALSRDEFIVPADVVSGLGNGSSNAGADKLYKMMDRVRKARTGIKKQGKQIKGDRYVPA